MSRLIDPRVQHSQRLATARMHDTLNVRAEMAERRAREIRPLTLLPLVGCPLTAAEIDILRFASEGLTNGQIATARGSVVSTVKNHFTGILRKLGALNRADAVRQMDDAWPYWRSGVREGNPTMPVRDVVRQLRATADRLESEARLHAELAV
jgi:DNA-binding NarL/FixJ family response regulator